MTVTLRNRVGIVALSLLVASAVFGMPNTERSTAVSEGVTVLPFPILDAEFSASLNAIVVVREAPNQLVIYDPEAGTSQAVDLPAVPTAVGVSPDGLRAAVGHGGAISEVDLAAGTLLQTRPLGSTVFDVIHGGNGFAYAFDYSYAGSLNLATGAETSSSSSTPYLQVRLHPARDRIYGTDRYGSTGDVVRFNVGSGPAVYAYDSIYHGDFDFCGNVWISEDGLRLFTACGNTFRASADRDHDILFAGKLSEEFRIQWASHSSETNSVAILPRYAPEYDIPVRADDEVHYYAQDSLRYRGKVVLPEFVAEGRTSVSRGRWHFFNASGTKQYVVVQADADSGITNDYGLVTIDCTDASVSLPQGVIDVSGDSGQVSVDVIGSAGCAWTASADSAWMQTASTGVGKGAVLVNLRANTSSMSREATIRVGSATATIRQAPADPGTAEPLPLVKPLPFRVRDAEYSRALDAIVAVSEYELHIYATKARSMTSLSLDSVAFCVSVSPDGLRAAVGHSGSISYVDLVNATVIKKVDVTTDVLDVVLADNGYVYAFPLTRGWDTLRSIHIATNTETPQARGSLMGGSLGRLHPDGSWILAGYNLIGRSIGKFDVRRGVAELLYDAVDEHRSCKGLWVSEDGTRIYNECGDVFRSSPDPAIDLTPLGTVEDPSRSRWTSESSSFGSIAVVPTSSSLDLTPPPREDEIRYYALDSLALHGRMLLPSFVTEDASWQSYGRWHFFSADGRTQHIVVQAAPESGMLLDYGLVTVDCTNVVVSLASSSAQVGGEGGTVQVGLTTRPGCGWKPATASGWLTAGPTGVGDGVAVITVAANPSIAGRLGRVSIGNATLSIVQAGGGISSLKAAATASTSLSLTWTTSSFLSPRHYEVWRNSGNGFVLIGTPQTTSFVDSKAPARSALLYRVRAVMSDGSTTEFAFDFAHTHTLTDPSLEGLPLRAVHLEELRAIADALGVIAGVGKVTYTDLQLRGVVGKAVHILEVRDSINRIRAALKLAPWAFSPLSPGAPITAAATLELRNALQ